MNMRIGYIASRYPAVSHTFIRREVAAMRERGFEIDTFSLRRAEQVLSDEDTQERAATWAIVPQPLLRIAGEHAAAFATRPGAYLETLRTAVHHRMPGARSALWSLFHFAEAVLLGRELERRGVRHLHSHFSNAGGDVGMLAARYLGIGWSLTLHGSADFDAPTRSLLGEKIAASRFTVCVSHFGRALAMRLSDPRDWDKLSIVRCGVDPRALALRPSAPNNARARVLSVGRLSPEKGFLGLVDAFAAVCAQGIDAELRILGDGPERARIEARIAQHGLTDRSSCPVPCRKSKCGPSCSSPTSSRCRASWKAYPWC